jgi:hypothetical protein
VVAAQAIAVGSELGRVSVAVLRHGKAFAFTDASYAFMDRGLGNPDWVLEIGRTYLVDVHVKGADGECNETFKLEYLSHDFREFRLQVAR